MPKYTVTYTTDKAQHLDDDFFLIEILAHTQKEAELIINNVERMFNGVTVQCEEHVPPRKRKDKTNSDRRKKTKTVCHR